MSMPLRNIWYFVCRSRQLKPGKMSRQHICGEPLVIGRDDKGAVFALLDMCPHRAAPLSAGWQEQADGETQLVCPYHGWRIRAKDGVCSRIPALSEKKTFPVEKLRTPALPVREVKGTVWVYVPEDVRRFSGEPVCAPPELETAVSAAPKLVIEVESEGPYDEAVIGLIDPAHTPYVHQQWFWRNPDEAREKVKQYEPKGAGFVLKAHPPSANGRAYRLIGGQLTTEIEFRLPGTRLETIRNEKHTILGLTAITPREDGKNTITQMFFWDMPLLTAAWPFMKGLGTIFLKQDGRILVEQNRNIKRFDPAMIYVDDPDELAKWYHKLRRAWVASVEEGTEFENPLEPATLYWRT